VTHGPRSAAGADGRPVPATPDAQLALWPDAARAAGGAPPRGGVRVAALASGSGGNALLLEAEGERLLLDCGLAPRELARRLARHGLAPRDLTGLILTHEHADHARGASALALGLELPVYATTGTLRAIVAAASRPPDGAAEPAAPPPVRSRSIA